MSDLAIRVENISKQYRIGLAHSRPDTMRDLIMSKVRRFRHIFNIGEMGTHASPRMFHLRSSVVRCLELWGGMVLVKARS